MSVTMRRSVTSALLASLAALGVMGCEHVHSYVDPSGPRYAGVAEASADDPEPDLRVVSFNVQFARHVDLAIEDLRTRPELRDVDVLLMQEMNAPGIAAVARALSFHYVYYPATERGSGGFGNAVLSRWPIVEDHKVLLPHPSPANQERRVAVAATIDAPFGLLVAYSLHTETPWMPLHGRLDQWTAVLEDLDRRYDRRLPAVVGGDLNTPEVWQRAAVQDLFRLYSFHHASATVGPTADYYVGDVTLDYVFVRSLRVGESGALRSEASDHRPVYVVLSPGRAGR